MQGTRVPPGRRLVQLGQQRLARLLTRVVGELHGDGLRSPQGLLAIQALDGFLRLVAFVKPDETYSPRYACSRYKQQATLVPAR